MRRLKFVFILCCLIVAGISYAYAEEIKDARTLVKLPDEIKEKMVILMRDHIHALEDIIHAVQIEEYDKAERIAESRLGWSSSAQLGDQEVIKHWPEPMQKMANQLYQAASNYVIVSQKAAIEDGKEDDRIVIAALGEVITACRSCHETYRLR